MVYYAGMYGNSVLLQHHGILGMKWGKRNGPPYPLDAPDHSASEKKAGWRKSLNKSSNDSSKSSGAKNEGPPKERKKLTSKQKRNIAVTVAALAVIGGTSYYLYSSGKFDNVKELLQKDPGVQKLLSAPAKPLLLPEGRGNIPSRIKESLSDTLSKGNPLKGTIEGKNNCVPSSITGFLRQMGFDVTAKGTGGVQINPGGAWEECFKGIKVKEGSAIKFGKSPKDAAEMLVKKFGQNAEGVCNVTWKNGGGHAFNFRINDGKVSFFDTKQGLFDSQIFSYWDNIDLNGALHFARLDGLEINWDAVKKYCNFA